LSQETNVTPHPPTPALPPEVSHLTTFQMIIAGVVLFLVLWLAYKIGKVILRIVAGLLFVGLVGYGIWYLFFR
jgi:hypothetical protein